MSSNLEVVQTAYRRFGEGDIPGVLDLRADPPNWEFAVGLTADDVPFAGKRRGMASLGQWFEMFGDMTEITVFEPREFIDSGDTVIVLGNANATYKSTGKAFAGDWAHVLRLADGKIVSFWSFQDTAGVRDAATA